MNFDIYNILMLVGGIQGIIFFIIVCFSKKYQTKSIFYLAALILCFALNNLQYFLLDSNVINIDQFFGIFYLPLASLSMVLYFLYVKFFLFPESKLTRFDQLLFLPFSIFVLLTLSYKLLLAFGSLNEGLLSFFTKLVTVHEGFALVFSFLLLVLIFRQISIYEKMHQESPKDRIDWLKYTSFISLLITLLYGVSIYMETFSTNPNSSFFYGLWIFQSFVIYWLGHIGIYQYGIREDQKNILVYCGNQKLSDSVASKNVHISNFERFIIEEKNFLNSELTLELTSAKLGLSKSYLSRLIHAELNISYTDYINLLRVEEAKVIIQSSASEKFTLIAIGLEVGFNSKSTFNNAFKKHTGLTPSEFKKVNCRV